MVFDTISIHRRIELAMNTSVRMKQMAHLKQKQISDNSCKAIIIDTLLDAVQPLTTDELSHEIKELFHVLVSTERLNDLIKALLDDGIVRLNKDNHIEIETLKKVEFLNNRLQENNLRDDAIHFWIDHIREAQDVPIELEMELSKALPIFLRSLFVRHGVSSYELLISTDDRITFDVKQLASSVSQMFDNEYSSDIEQLLPTIFQAIYNPTIVEYLKHGIEKAVGYISEVISDENMDKITDELKELTVYLDTNTLYRLLNLQGKTRYESIKETIDFCKKYGVKLKVSAQTRKELSSRLKFDARVLLKYPTRTSLIEIGYRYRTSENYVSTYWSQARTTHISIEDYIEYYQNYDLLLSAEGVVLEDIIIDEQFLIENTKDIYERMSILDSHHDKGETSLWHDAYCFAYVQKMQNIDAQNAIDTHCLFLTTDQALINFQRVDHSIRKRPPVAITPSQLLQMFSF